MLSRRLLVLFGGLAVISAYLYLGENVRGMLIPGAIGIAGAIVVWVLQFQIDGWWYKQFPPKLPEEMHAMYHQTQHIYQKMNPDARKSLEQRIAMFVITREFIPQGPESIPEDLKYMMGFYAALLSCLPGGERVMDQYQRFVFYLHPFITPSIPDDVHLCEVESDDGTIILTVENALLGFGQTAYYDIAAHAVAEALIHSGCPWAEAVGTVSWMDLERVSGVTKERIEDYLGVRLDIPGIIAMHHFFKYPVQFSTVLPEVWEKLHAIFGARLNQGADEG